MNASIRFAASFAALTLTAAAQTSITDAVGSFDPRSPECGVRSAGAAVTLDGRLQVAFDAQLLGVPDFGNVDAFSTGHELFDALGPAGRPTALRFSVDRNSQGAHRTVTNQARGNGAAADLFLLDFASAPGQPRLDRDGSGLTHGASDLDALLGALPHTARYPLFFSVDPFTAQHMQCHPADVLWIPAPGAQPGPFLHHHELGLVAGDDIDALSAGPAGLVFSLTAQSPTAQLMPEIGGAGLFCNGPFPWAAPELLGLLPTDELNALQCFDPMQLGQPTLTHTPMLPGQPCILRTTDLLPGSSPWVLCSFREPQQISIPGLTLDIHPDFVLDILPPADPLGMTQTILPIPPHTGGISLALQAVVPPMPVPGSAWQTTNPVQSDIKIAWVRTTLTRGAANNGYDVTSPRGVEIVNFRNVRPVGGALLNGPQQVQVIAVVNGQRRTWTPTVDFTNGNATWGLPVGPGDTVIIQRVIVYPWV